ncbi:MAG: 7-carboxy-7-deazaguanine synthase QueE [Gammaproteobacteria bacterium]|nr:7-carboxy-7-deazaguanine synthase QueE [Gammaproteobacteria bacterium]NBX40566.1 7-carboxy-7-deazaguanine synthase QueE [Gammaproteobacteria bacterium]
MSEPAATRLRLTEIFRSLQGEADSVGVPTVFVRLTGCPLRCVYCDTAYAFSGGTNWELPQILARVRELEASYVCVTGGEPLAQPGVHALLAALCDAGYRVSLETSGAIAHASVDPRVVRVVDVKTPASGEQQRNLYAELESLAAKDQIKFVIADRADYEWSREQLLQRRLDARCTVLFSPSHGVLPPGTLADWILEDRLPVRFQIQLHKYLWGDVPGR